MFNLICLATCYLPCYQVNNTTDVLMERKVQLDNIAKGLCSLGQVQGVELDLLTVIMKPIVRVWPVLHVQQWLLHLKLSQQLHDHDLCSFIYTLCGTIDGRSDEPLPMLAPNIYYRSTGAEICCIMSIKGVDSRYMYINVHQKLITKF